MKSKYNAGLGLLRTLMCFIVILNHCWDGNNQTGVLRFFANSRCFAVPVFMFMSFYFVRTSLIKHDKDIMLARFERLAIPEVMWALVYFAIYKAIDLLTRSDSSLNAGDLLWQIFTGHSPSLNETMWFQADLIYITVIFLVVVIAFKKHFDYVLIVLGIVSLVIQYSGINGIFAGLRPEISFPVGRLFEVLPVAATGFVFAGTGLFDYIKKHAVISAAASAFIIGINTYTVILPASTDYGYAGVRMIVTAASYFVFFYLLPFERLNNRAREVIKKLTDYTLGIYCSHLLMATLYYRMVSKLFPELQIRTFAECIVLYLVCYFCSALGAKILGKTRLKAMFN